MLFTAERLWASRNAASLNIALTRSWQSSNVPSTATVWTFGDSTVVICRRWTSLTRPCGYRITMSTFAQFFTPSIAALPVSPLVAPTIITRSLRAVRIVSNKRPSSCNATSLKARVGPWNSSMR